MCALNSLSIILHDSWTPRNSGTNFNLGEGGGEWGWIGGEFVCVWGGGGYVTRYRYITHLYCLAVQAGFYDDAVEGRTLSPAYRV